MKLNRSWRDLGQKWKLTLAQFDLNHKFARTHNPDDDSMTSGPGIYDNYKRQLNVYQGETSVYNRDHGHFYLRTAISDCLLIGSIIATETLRKN
jgi:hypothetical protein